MASNPQDNKDDPSDQRTPPEQTKSEIEGPSPQDPDRQISDHPMLRNRLFELLSLVLHMRDPSPPRQEQKVGHGQERSD